MHAENAMFIGLWIVVTRTDMTVLWFSARSQFFSLTTFLSFYHFPSTSVTYSHRRSREDVLLKMPYRELFTEPVCVSTVQLL